MASWSSQNLILVITKPPGSLAAEIIYSAMLLDLPPHRGIWNSASASSSRVCHCYTEVMLIFMIHLQGSSPSSFLVASLCWWIRTWAALEAFKALITSFPMTDARGIMLGWPSRCTGKPVPFILQLWRMSPSSLSFITASTGLGTRRIFPLLCGLTNSLNHWVFRDFITHLGQKPIDLGLGPKWRDMKMSPAFKKEGCGLYCCLPTGLYPSTTSRLLPIRDGVGGIHQLESSNLERNAL